MITLSSTIPNWSSLAPERLLVPRMNGLLHSAIRLLVRNFFVAGSIIVTIFLTTTTLEAAQELSAHETTFVQKASQGQLGEIALGNLAFKKASNKEIREFGAEIVEDHEYASQELKGLSAEEDIYLPVQPDDKNKKQHQRLSRLSGKTFDEAFIGYLLKNHRQDLQEFEKNAAMLQNEKVKQWAETMVPTLRFHLNKAERIADALRSDQGG